MIRLGNYKHTKSGKQYKVIALAKHSETLEDIVVYETLYDVANKYWVRPAIMWEELIDINGEKLSRFTYLDE